MRMRFLAVAALAGAVCAQQMADPNFDARVANPAYTAEHPTVVIDEAHHNFHTLEGRYKPFAELLRNDGYRVVAGKRAFSAAGLREARVLVIANALGAGATAGTDTSVPAFTHAECEAVRDWVQAGGSLLLISDHTPFGTAALEMGSVFGVKLGQGFVFATDTRYTSGNATFLLFSRDNGLLLDHPITQGRNEKERIGRVIAFTGQSLSVPEGASILMQLPAEAREAPTRAEMAAVRAEGPEKHSTPASGAQGIAMRAGKGRVVILGEAAMMSAQVVRGIQRAETKMGMNVPGNDDRQFALNVLHWLTGLF